MNFIDEKKRILIFAVLLIFLFIVLYIAVSYYGRLESIRTGNVDIFNIENINIDKVDNDDKKLSSKSNIFKNNISDEGNFNSESLSNTNIGRGWSYIIASTEKFGGTYKIHNGDVTKIEIELPMSGRVYFENIIN